MLAAALSSAGAIAFSSWSVREDVKRMFTVRPISAIAVPSVERAVFYHLPLLFTRGVDVFRPYGELHQECHRFDLGEFSLKRTEDAVRGDGASLALWLTCGRSAEPERCAQVPAADVWSASR
jgi:hypothetical protein